MDAHRATVSEVTAEAFDASRPGEPHRVVLHWTVATYNPNAPRRLALSVSGDVSELRALLADADALLAAYDEGEATCEHCGQHITRDGDTWRDQRGNPGCGANRGGHSPTRDDDGNPVREDDEARVWNEHSNDLGDWCPHSGDPVPAEDDDDAACPAGCRSSYPTDED